MTPEKSSKKPRKWRCKPSKNEKFSNIKRPLKPFIRVSL
jgi:hypothetical protein